MGVTSANRRDFFLFSHFLSPVALNMQPKFLVLEVQKITNFLELTFFLDLLIWLAVPYVRVASCWGLCKLW
jgi:hypothetical protein